MILIVCFRIVFDIDTKFPAIYETVNIDQELHIQLQYNGKLCTIATICCKKS